MWRGFIPRPFLYDRIVGDVYILKAGETIIMPAKKPHAVYEEERFKICIYRKYICKYRFFLRREKLVQYPEKVCRCHVLQVDKQYITVDNSYKLLYTVYSEGGIG